MLTKTSSIDRIPAGWLSLLEDLEQQLLLVYSDYTVLQIKSKFGSLRYYYDIPLSEDNRTILKKKFDDLIHNAWEKSKTICEFCGEAGDIQPDVRYVSVWCGKCHKNR